MAKIKTFELDRWSEPDEKRRVRHIGMADAKETFDRLQTHLELKGLLPDEYFLFSDELTGELPEFDQALCIPNFGASEGIYLDISLACRDKDGKRYFQNFATGKTLGETADDYARYFTSWEQITPVSFPNPMQNRIIENYCSGVYLSPDQVIQLLKDMEQDPKVLEDLEGLWSNGQIAVLKKALSAAAKSGVGLLEATEVVEPNPISPNESTSYSNLYHCDRDGVYLYIDAVSGQLADAIGKNEG